VVKIMRKALSPFQDFRGFQRYLAFEG